MYEHGTVMSEPPNGLALSRAATIDWYGCRAESTLQKRLDLARRHAASATAPGWAGPQMLAEHNKQPSCLLPTAHHRLATVPAHTAASPALAALPQRVEGHQQHSHHQRSGYCISKQAPLSRNPIGRDRPHVQHRPCSKGLAKASNGTGIFSPMALKRVASTGLPTAYSNPK
jgi:hypothetical protein